jgi:hypothetical protein
MRKPFGIYREESAFSFSEAASEERSLHDIGA